MAGFLRKSPTSFAQLWLRSVLSTSFEEGATHDDEGENMTTKTLRWVCLISVLMIGWAGGSARAQQVEEPGANLLDLTIEDLMDIKVLNVNVLGTHTHLAGEWMIGYQPMVMSMTGNREGPRPITDSEVLQNFMVTPTSMRMDMQMFHLMYAPTDEVTLMVMAPYLRLSMDHLTRMGTRFTTDSAGFGDTKAELLYTAYGDVREAGHRILLGSGVSLPTGSIDQRGDTPAGRNQLLPYPMQLGSGTFDLLPSVAYLGQTDRWAWLSLANATVRLGKNSSNYALGDRLRLTAWGARKLTEWVAVNGQVEGQIWGNIDGAHPGLIPGMVPTADPTLRGGRRVDFSIGLDFYVAEGTANGNRLAVKLTRPFYESLEGPQLETDWHLTAGWSWTF